MANREKLEQSPHAFLVETVIVTSTPQQDQCDEFLHFILHLKFVSLKFYSEAKQFCNLPTLLCGFYNVITSGNVCLC